jgi:DNA-binding transcriptional MerR regulator
MLDVEASSEQGDDLAAPRVHQQSIQDRRHKDGAPVSAEPARAYLAIGEVIAQLRGEFPDISVSKIRFLESEGLIQPARSPSGYRKFGASDVDRLRYILTAQRDQYLPLRVIKDQLDSDQPAAGPLTRRDLLDATGIGEAKLAELEEFGLVLRSGRQYPPEALEAIRAIAALSQYGVQARHLRVLRASAERETALIEQVVAPIVRQRSPGARSRASLTAQDIASLVLDVHAALIEMMLADAGFSGAGPAGPGG